MSVQIDRVYRCGDCGALRDEFGVHYNRHVGSSTDRCPDCHALSPPLEPTLRVTVRRDLPAPRPDLPDREPDVVRDGVEVYVTRTRGEAAAAVDRREVRERRGDAVCTGRDDDE